MKKELSASDKILYNNKYQSKLSWKRIEALKDKEGIAAFIEDNFDVVLPKFERDFKYEKGRNEKFQFAFENVPHLIREYYKLGGMGVSVATKFENNGKIETYTMGHLFSKHRTDPVWNWRKSQLIRKKYKDYLFAHPEIIDQYHPVHMVLTLPHSGGLYKGKEFYVKELIVLFRYLRKLSFWNIYVWGGEYGVEVKKGFQGLHIHIHSLLFLKRSQVNKFRELLRTKWESLTGASHIWVETLYFFKRDSDGKVITEIKQTKQIEEYIDEWNDFVVDFKKIEVRKKFYVDRERKEIEANTELSPEEKQQQILDCYVSGIMECIKYHFKGNEILDDYLLREEVCENTFNQRLYSRFGAFFKESELSFNTTSASDENTVEETEELLAEAVEVAINPFTLEEVKSTEACLVSFYPNQQRRQPATSGDPFALINNQDKSIYTEIPSGLTVKRALQIIIEDRFKKRKTMKPAPDVVK